MSSPHAMPYFGPSHSKHFSSRSSQRAENDIAVENLLKPFVPCFSVQLIMLPPKPIISKTVCGPRRFVCASMFRIPLLSSASPKEVRPPASAKKL